MEIIFKEVDGITYEAEYTVDGNMLTVYGVNTSKSSQLNGIREESLAKILLGHLIREGKAEEQNS
ncbi:hypothetical protein [Agarilytica rhodophyticola]|uniref:hypothetical protein n=1 Tax=Agarilytica rhodophyticola TaxID=1737490 RepID=UPI000B342C9E|nr:hypothetical protein [Agarilytica rhodophyticola]